MKNSLEVKNLTVAYSGRVALWNVSLSAERGVLMAIAGPNGAGKTTFIKAVQNLVPAAAGKISVLGGSYESRKRRVAYVPQSENVDWNFPASVEDVALMGAYPSLGWVKRPGKKEKQKTFEALKKVGMEKLSARHIGEISGGQRQRVFIARALVQDADLYLMDEPFQGVDKPTEITIAKIMKEMKRAGKTAVAVHHDLNTAADYFDRIALLNQKVTACGPAAETLTRENISLAYGAGSPVVFTENVR